MDHHFCQDNAYTQWKQGLPRDDNPMDNTPNKCCCSKPSTIDSSFSIKLKVALRVRPPNDKERRTKHKIVVHVTDDQSLILLPKKKGDRCETEQQYNKDTLFIFDKVFNQNSQNEDVFNEVVKDLITSLLDGFNCSVFFYGATGTGKTHTMFGKPNAPGIIFLTIQELFDCVDLLKAERDFKINVSYLEIYNENIYDLLRSSTSLKIMDDGRNGLIISGLYYPRINTAQELMGMINKGNVKRTQFPTGANKESSRSHAVCQIYIKTKKLKVNQENLAKLSMTDLAGSETATSGYMGDRYKEAANINRNFLVLGNCINALARGSKFIPYRDSKLTRLLRDSLGGNCKTIMIATISPTSLTYETTLNTLNYARRAKKIKMRLKRNSIQINPTLIPCSKRIITLTSQIQKIDSDVIITKSEPEMQQTKQEDPAKQIIELMNNWKTKIDFKSAPHFLLLKSYLKAENMKKELLAKTLRKRRVGVTICSIFCDNEDKNIRTTAFKRASDLENEAKMTIQDAQGMDASLDETWNRLKTSEEDFKVFLDDLLATQPVMEYLVEATRNQRSNIISQMHVDHLTSIIRMQDEELNLFMDFLKETFGEDD